MRRSASPRSRRTVLVALAFTALTAAVAPPPAAATFPGHDGLIAFSQGDVFPTGGNLSQHSQVYTVSPSGGPVTQLTHVPSNQAAAAPDWSPNGSRIAYESNQTGSFQIWVMNADGSGPTQITHERSYQDFLPSFSPNGRRIVFSRCAEPFGPPGIAFCDLDSISIDGSGRRTLLSAGHWTNVRAEYSPNGRQIAFQSDRGGYVSAVWIMRADGSHVRRLTPPAMEGFWPDFAPNGRRVLFSTNNNRPAGTNTWTVRPTGGGLHQLTHNHGAGVGFSGYSPSGRRIVSIPGCGGSPDCFSTMNADGSHLTRVVTGVSFTFLPDWGSAP